MTNLRTYSYGMLTMAGSWKDGGAYGATPTVLYLLVTAMPWLLVSHMHISPCIYIYMCVCEWNAYIHTYMHACIHTYIHPCIYIYILVGMVIQLDLYFPVGCEPTNPPAGLAGGQASSWQKEGLSTGDWSDKLLDVAWLYHDWTCRKKNGV